jgi:hypothetical protein
MPTNGQRPLELIERRARAIRLRRRATVAGIALAAAGAVAVPSLAASVGGTANNVEPAGPDTVDVAPRCDTWSGEKEGDYLALAEVPDHLRLLWAEDAAPPPTKGSMIDFTNAEEIITDRSPTDCVIPDDPYSLTDHDAVSVYTFSGDVVMRRVSVHGPYDDEPMEYDHPRVLETAVGPLTVSTMEFGHLQAVWPASEDDRLWVSWINGEITDAELVELAESVTVVGGRVDLGNWSGADDGAIIVHASDTEHLEDSDTSFDLGGRPVSLTAWRGPFSEAALWEDLDTGDQFVDVNGQPGVLKTGPTGRLRWVTDDGVLVELLHNGRDGQEDLLGIARTVQPVPADDERLTAIWQDEPPANAGD